MNPAAPEPTFLLAIGLERRDSSGVSLKIYFLRHGQTTYSRDNAYCGAGLNPDLTDEGFEMARLFGEAYKALPWAAVYASPLRRTIATAKPLCDATGMTMELREGLREIEYGSWEGKSVAEVVSEFHDDHIRWSADPAWNAPKGGETALAIWHRASQVLVEIRQRFADGNVLIVSHKATTRVMLCGLLGIDVGRFRQRMDCPVGSVSVIEFMVNGPMLHLLADRSHLTEKLRSLSGT